jgi:hypothetical protein
MDTAGMESINAGPIASAPPTAFSAAVELLMNRDFEILAPFVPTKTAPPRESLACVVLPTNTVSLISRKPENVQTAPSRAAYPTRLIALQNAPD